jgi:hypothetical protein
VPATYQELFDYCHAQLHLPASFSGQLLYLTGILYMANIGFLQRSTAQQHPLKVEGQPGFSNTFLESVDESLAKLAKRKRTHPAQVNE